MFVLKHFLYNKEFASKHFKYLNSNYLFLKYCCAGNSSPSRWGVWTWNWLLASLLMPEELSMVRPAVSLWQCSWCGFSSLTSVEYKRIYKMCLNLHYRYNVKELSVCSQGWIFEFRRVFAAREVKIPDDTCHSSKQLFLTGLHYLRRVLWSNPWYQSIKKNLLWRSNCLPKCMSQWERESLKTRFKIVLLWTSLQKFLLLRGIWGCFHFFIY